MHAVPGTHTHTLTKNAHTSILYMCVCENFPKELDFFEKELFYTFIKSNEKPEFHGKRDDG